MLDVLLLIVPILLPILAGVLVVRTGLFSRADSHVLSLFFLYLAVPSLLIHQLSTQSLTELVEPGYVAGFLLLSFLLYGGVFFVQRIVLRRDLKTSALAAFAGSKFNAVILGLPVLHGILGPAASGPFVINVVLGYFTTLPLTVALVGGVGSTGQAGSAIHRALMATRDVFKDPLVLSALLGLTLSGLALRLPGLLDSTLQSLGSAAVPTALVAIGMSLSLGQVKEEFREVLWISLVRVAISPALAVGLALALDLPAPAAIALVLSFGIATSQMVVPLCERAGVYQSKAAEVVAVTTVAMIITLPALIWICSRLWPGPMLGKL
jgi:predicted permease